MATSLDDLLAGNMADQLTLAAVERLQAEFDAAYWSGPSDPIAKRRHIFFHIVIMAAKLARHEERYDHGIEDSSGVDDATADMLVFAVQLARLADRPLASIWAERLRLNAGRLPKVRLD